ncbi:MAG: Co2+/Mg2+ efflux protein ApaG [Gammaproteobacteria bacterium]|nr:Co2+/Mg2+ efflux protein ApaG [Gammaproteobacteria bacterium]NNC96882.1 Co2+/Mg2+ efflux protein ApaG [Gammaproteobacteria bacterium]NNM12770.1 Co2+/Mg2+ efflux protein ApaG [Gammaproteobacteria bacterium]
MSQDSINVSVQTEYIEAQSDALNGVFTFAYHVEISNNSSETVQLITRKWIITDANGITKEVSGEGVVGLQPVLQPGQVHRYTSGAVLKTPIGCMYGHYGMRTMQGDTFNANIPVFSLAVPGLVN